MKTVILSITTTSVTLMVVIVALNTLVVLNLIKLLEMIIVPIFTTSKCVILMQEIVVTTLQLLMAFVMTPTTIDFANMMVEIAVLEIRILIVALYANALKSLT